MSKKDKEQQAVEAEVVESQVVESGDYVVNKKPELDARTKELLDLRYDMSHKRVKFYRQEWFRFSRLGRNGGAPRYSQQNAQTLQISSKCGQYRIPRSP